MKAIVRGDGDEGGGKEKEQTEIEGRARCDRGEEGEWIRSRLDVQNRISKGKKKENKRKKEKKKMN